MKKNIKTIGLFAMILIVIVGFGFIISSGSTQNDLKDNSKDLKDNSKSAPEKSKGVPPGLEKHMVGPYLDTGGGVVKIEGIPEPPSEPPVGISDKKGDWELKGIKISSKKILKHISDKHGTPKEQLEIANEMVGNCVKVSDKKGKKTHGLCVNEKGVVTEEISIAGVSEENVPEAVELPEPVPDNMIEMPRNVTISEEEVTQNDR